LTSGMVLELELALDLIEPFEVRREKPAAQAVPHHQVLAPVRQRELSEAGR